MTATPASNGRAAHGPVPIVSRGEDMAVAFGQVLRGLGLAVPIGSVIQFAEALGLVGFDRRDGVYWAARSTLVHRPEDLGLFDRAFAVFWEQHGGPRDGPNEEEPMRITIAVDEGDENHDDPDSSAPDDDPTLQLRFSATEVLRHKDFAAYSDDELHEAHE